jgi:DNA-binding NarL/FixJ family response regulator
MKNRRHISLYASTLARRNWLSSLADKNFRTDTIRFVIRLESFYDPVNETVAEILVADLSTPSEAAAFVQFLRHSPVAIGTVALIDSPEARWAKNALAAGANAIISREPNADELRLAVDVAEAGLVLLQPSSVRSLAASALGLAAVAIDEPEELTRREREVLRLLGDGLGNKQIAARLAISEHTAKFHISSILGKLSVTSRTEAVSQGIKRGLIPI